MKIRGFLAVLVMVMVVIYFLMFVKTGKNQTSPIKAEVDQFIKTKIEMTKTNMSMIERALQLYIGTEGDCPKDMNALVSSGSINGYPLDGWGRSFRFQRLSSSSYRLSSAGQDGQFDTEDDIVVEH